jgi:uncharacterized membrane protein
MICLSFLVYLPKKAILLIGFILVAGHNLLDGMVMEGKNFTSIIWYLLHQQARIFNLGPFDLAVFKYPVIPWIGLMALGYCFGNLYKKDFDARLRKKWLLLLGFGCLALFFIIRGINIYGNLLPWAVQDTLSKSVMSFFSVTKYPPSLSYLLITMGPALLFLVAIENYKNKATDFLLAFGRVPLYFYFMHVLLIHALAIAGMLIFEGNWQDMILDGPKFSPALMDYGYSLGVVYLVWIAVIIMLYPSSKKYMLYKATHKNKWWLSYL